MRMQTLLIVLAFGCLGIGCQAKTAGQVEQIPANATLSVTSTSFASGTTIPEQFTGNGANQSPALAWSGAPSGAKSAFLMVEDPDAPQATPFVHWMVANLPANGALKEGQNPLGVQGKNDFGTPGYSGPKPPPGAAHHYHFRVFALDESLTLQPGFDRSEAMAAVQSHTLAQGELIGVYQSH